MSHPLHKLGLKSSQFKCFGEEPQGVEEFSPITVIIGRNNSGKSALVDSLEYSISGNPGESFNRFFRPNESPRFQVFQPLDRNLVDQHFRRGSHGGFINGSHSQYALTFIEEPLVRVMDQNKKFIETLQPTLQEVGDNHRDNLKRGISESVPWPFKNLSFRKISAERRVRPEGAQREFNLTSDGEGVTNLVRGFINNDSLPRAAVEKDLLDDLNKVYLGDCEFSRITCLENTQNGIWEIFVSEESKGEIRLSQSGSSLQSIFLILCTLRLWPQIESINHSTFVYAVEEPENNLHPALLRRLLNFLAEMRQELKFSLIITTHSPIAIDWAAKREDSQIAHVLHDGKDAAVRMAIDYQDNCAIIEDLDFRASDLLQANGIIWVEGPSERIYLRRWLELISDGEIKEGIHYTSMFYGGRLLSHLDVLPPEDSGELVSLLSINRNCAVIIDSDRTDVARGSKKPRIQINATKKRVKEEVEKISGFVWITEGREIENYTPIEVFAKVLKGKAPKVTPYTKLTDKTLFKKYKNDKVGLAHVIADHITLEDIQGHLDLEKQLLNLCKHIQRWNGA